MLLLVSYAIDFYDNITHHHTINFLPSEIRPFVSFLDLITLEIVQIYRVTFFIFSYLH